MRCALRSKTQLRKIRTPVAVPPSDRRDEEHRRWLGCPLINNCNPARPAFLLSQPLCLCQSLSVSVCCCFRLSSCKLLGRCCCQRQWQCFWLLLSAHPGALLPRLSLCSLWVRSLCRPEAFPLGNRAGNRALCAARGRRSRTEDSVGRPGGGADGFSGLGIDEAGRVRLIWSSETSKSPNPCRCSRPPAPLKGSV